MLIVYSLLFLWTIFTIYYMYKVWVAKSSDVVIPYIYDSIPVVFTTIGVLGTFVGIYIGLRRFDVYDINSSIPPLLGGLKTAFTTSIWGISLSLLFGKLSQIVLYRAEEGTIKRESKETEVLEEIKTAIVDLKSQIHVDLTKLNNALSGDGETSLHLEVSNLCAKILEVQTEWTSKLHTLEKISQSLYDSSGNSVLVQLQKVVQAHKDYSLKAEESSLSIVRLIEQVDKNAGIRSKECLSWLEVHTTKFLTEAVRQAITEASEIQELKDSINTIKNQNHTDLQEIQTALTGKTEVSIMTKLQNIEQGQREYIKDIKENATSIMRGISQIQEMFKVKFEEFSYLLKDSNTKVLVDIMKQLSEEFSFQMSALVEKLVQENFQELNTSVQRMNQWQQENKAIVQDTVLQFQQILGVFKSTAISMQETVAMTEKLTEENGVLLRLIEELRRTMIDDTKFQEMADKIALTVSTLKDNTEAFDMTTHKLNDWVRNQMDFSDSVTKLLVKLEEVEKIKDINEVFWENTKAQLNEGVGLIAQASKALAADLENLNAEFYERLNDTLHNLDSLILRIIKKNEG